MTRPAAPPEDAVARERAERQMVADAAWVLRISEYDLFRLAFRRWHGRDADEDRLDGDFHAFLARGAVPAWARDYCRRVLEARERGALDPHDFGADTVRRREPVMQFSARFIALSMVAMLLLYLLLTQL